jgi:hypothetical protein
MTRSALGTLLFAILAVLADVRPLRAQSALYVTGAGFAEIKQFDRLQYDPRVLATDDDFSQDATGAGGGLRVGTFLHPRWSLELGVEAGSKTRKTMPNPYFVILGSPQSSLRRPELAESTRFLTVSTVIGFHPPKVGRVRLGYLGGFTIVRGTYDSEVPDYSILPAGRVTLAPPGTIGQLVPTIFPPPEIRFSTIKRVDQAAGALIGLEASIDITEDLAAVPGIRAITFSNSGQTVFLIRPELGVRWNF